MDKLLYIRVGFRLHICLYIHIESSVL